MRLNDDSTNPPVQNSKTAMEFENETEIETNNGDKAVASETAINPIEKGPQ
jgi:hypothetical protein